MAKKTDEITPPKMNILAQYVRDLSFENILAQKGVDGELNPEIQVNVNIDAKKRTTDKQFDVIIKLRVDSKSKNTTADPNKAFATTQSGGADPSWTSSVVTSKEKKSFYNFFIKRMFKFSRNFHDNCFIVF